MQLRRITCLGLAALALLPATATADHGEPPWATGVHHDSPLELAASRAASQIANRTVKARCHGGTEWQDLLSRLNLPGSSDVDGFVRFSPDGHPTDTTELSDGTCYHLNEFWRDGAAEKRCELGTGREVVERPVRTRVKIKRKIRVKVDGKWQTRTKTVVQTRMGTRLVVRRYPLLGLCPEFPHHVVSVWTLAHEAHHLAGEANEAVTDCRALQSIAGTATALGATAEFARDVADYAWRLYPEVRGGTEYFTTACRNGGPLDLHPESPVWP
jgi:hypothetical protein